MSDAQLIPAGFCQCGCGARTNRITTPRVDRGLKRGDYRKYIAEHRNRRGPDYWIVDPETGCWNWAQSMSTDGYGQWRGNRAHRSVYQKLVGPVPEGLTLDHLCRNRRCVNPDHLEPVTNAENSRRGANAKLTHEDVAAIRNALAGGAMQVTLAVRFGVSHSTIGDVARGRTWVVK